MNTPSTPDLNSWNAQPTYRDRSTGLTIFGILQIMAGGLCALMVPLALFGFLMSKKVGGISTPIGSQLVGVTEYLVAAIILIVLGIGSVQAKRWAYALSLILSYVCLIGGVLGTIAITALLPVIMKTAMRQASGGQQTPTALMAVILTFSVAFLAIFMIVLPIIFLIFYRKKDVWETCRHRDPVERWTDRVPLPILAASLFFFASGCMSIFSVAATRLFPFFGIYIVGIPGTLALLIVAAVDFYLARAFYQVQPASWYVALTVRVLLIASTLITTLRSDLMSAYVKLGMSSEQLRVLNSNPITIQKRLCYLALATASYFSAICSG